MYTIGGKSALGQYARENLRDPGGVSPFTFANFVKFFLFFLFFLIFCYFFSRLYSASYNYAPLSPFSVKNCDAFDRCMIAWEMITLPVIAYIVSRLKIVPILRAFFTASITAFSVTTDRYDFVNDEG